MRLLPHELRIHAASTYAATATASLGLPAICVALSQINRSNALHLALR